MKEFYTVKEIILGLRDYSIDFNNKVYNLIRYVNIPKGKKEKPSFYMCFTTTGDKPCYSLNYLPQSTSKIRNLAISKYLVNKVVGIDNGDVVASSETDIVIPKRIENYVVDKDKYFSIVKDIIDDEFVKNHLCISNLLKRPDDEQPIPRNNHYIDQVEINPRGVSINTNTLNMNLSYDATKDKFVYRGINKNVNSSELEDFLNIKIHRKYLNDFIINLIDNNCMDCTDIIVERFSVLTDTDQYKETNRTFDMDVSERDRVLYISR
jgi:hypothetical protein